jgi:monofunctional biosynthetic peptidoglycan transglycosylase
MVEESDSSQKSEDPGPVRQARTPLWRRPFVWAAVIMPVLILAVLTALTAWTWPDVDALDERNPQTTAFIDTYRARADSRGASPEVLWTWVPYDSISPHLKRAVLVAEDIGFFSHRGFETTEIKEAIRDALSGERSLRGASTITQQLAKNLWLSPSRSLLRKLKEAALTYQLEHELSKRRILELYLNVVEFGPGVYGAEAAARYYFGKPAAALDPREAALLAAGLPRPSRWNPASDNQWYRRYTSDIQKRMERAEFLWRRI